MKVVSFTNEIQPRVQQRVVESKQNGTYESYGKCVFEVLHEIAQENRGDKVQLRGCE